MDPLMRHDVVLEFDPSTGHWTATVPGMQGIIVDARTEKTALRMVTKAIAYYRDEHPSPIEAKVVSVEV